MTIDVLRSGDAGWTTGSVVCADHEMRMEMVFCVCVTGYMRRGCRLGIAGQGKEKRWRSNGVYAVAGGCLQLSCNATAPRHFEVRIGKVPLLRIGTGLTLSNKIVFKLVRVDCGWAAEMRQWRRLGHRARA